MPSPSTVTTTCDPGFPGLFANDQNVPRLGLLAGVRSTSRSILGETMRSILCPLLIVASCACAAGEQTVAIPGEAWRVTFDAPDGLVTQAIPRENQFYAFGRSDRFTVSLTIYPPNCVGGTTAKDNLACLRAKAAALPGIVAESLSVEERPECFVLSYVWYIQNGTVLVKTLHTHVLFERAGKWGDLHASVVRPRIEEAAQLLGLGDKFRISE